MNHKHAAARKFQQKFKAAVNDEPDEISLDGRSDLAREAVNAAADLCRSLGIEIHLNDDASGTGLCELTRTEPRDIASVEVDDTDFVSLVEAICGLNHLAARVEVAMGLDCDQAFDFISEDRMQREPGRGSLYDSDPGFDRKGLARLLRKQYPNRSMIFRE